MRRPSLQLRNVFASLCILLSAASLSQSPGSASLHGVVHDARGNAVSNAEVKLQSADSNHVQTVHSDIQGNYSLTGVQEGVYSLRVVTESGTAEIHSLFLSRAESKTADLTLTSAKLDAAASSSDSPKFFDEPHFTVSGVTDTTSLGGHGSDTIVRTRDCLAKAAASLGKPTANRADESSEEEKLLRATLQKSPDNFEANHQLGKLLVESGKANEALPYLEAAANSEPPPPNSTLAQLHHDLAQAAEQTGDSLRAVGEYKRAAELAPTEPYYFDWGSELLVHHAPEPAIEVFTKGNQLFPRSSRMLIGLGAARFTHGDAKAAAEKIVAASDLNPNDPAPYVFLGRMQAAESTTTAEIVDRLQRFVTLQPENAEANYYCAVALGKLHRSPSEIEPLLNKAVRLDPKFALAHLQLGILHSQQGHDSVAISDYQRAIESDSQLEEAHYRLAQAYRVTGQADKAREELQIYEQLSKESAQQVERERHEIRQFVYTLRDRPAGQNP